MRYASKHISLNIEDFTDDQIKEKINQTVSRIKVSMCIMPVLAVLLVLILILPNDPADARWSYEVLVMLQQTQRVGYAAIDLSLLAFSMGALAYYTGNLRYLKTEQRIRKLWHRFSELYQALETKK